jgi:hypothetical protein
LLAILATVGILKLVAFEFVPGVRLGLNSCHLVRSQGRTLMSLKPSSRMKRRFLKWTGIALLAAAVGIVLLSLGIELGVQKVCKAATQKRPGERIHALLVCVESNESSYHEKCRALWALGQLGDRRALPSLKKHVTGKPCDHENDVCCQGELQEAIQKLEASQFNLPAFLWRGILNG